MEIREGAPGGDQAPAIAAVAIAAAAGGPAVAGGVEIVDELVVHAVFEEELDGAEGMLRDVAPHSLGILDLLPEIGYGEIGQCCHTGHGLSSFP